MIETSYTLIEEQEAKLNRIRRIVTIMRRPGFYAVFMTATPAEKLEIKKLIEAADENKVREWCKRIDLMKLSFSDLRRIAQNLHIQNYSRMAKIDLLAAIEGTKAND